MNKKLFILDKDGTVVQGELPTGRPGKTRPPNTAEEQVLLPNVSKVLWQLKLEGHIVVLASNQGGVAWGVITYQQADDLMAAACSMAHADDYIFCPYDPRAAVKFKSDLNAVDDERPYNLFARDSELRKPKPGMYLYLITKNDFANRLEDVIVVGDREDDRLAALAAGIPEANFIWAKNFFGWE